MFSSTHRKAQLSSINRRVNGTQVGGIHIYGKYQKLANEVEYKPPPSVPAYLENLIHPPPPSYNEELAMNQDMQQFYSTLSPTDMALYTEMQNIFNSTPNKLEAGLSVMGDPRFASMQQRMMSQVGGMSAKEFRQVQQTAHQMHDNRHEIANQMQMAQQRINDEVVGWNNGTSEAYHSFQRAQHNQMIRQQSYQPFLNAFYALRNELAMVQAEIAASNSSSLSKQLRDRIKDLVAQDERVKGLWRTLYERLHPVSNDSH